MTEENKHGTTESKAVDQQQACSAVGTVYSRKAVVAAIELIDGAYDIIELWKPQSPAQKAWRNAWMEKAKELGARPF